MTATISEVEEWAIENYDEKYNLQECKITRNVHNTYRCIQIEVEHTNTGFVTTVTESNIPSGWTSRHVIRHDDTANRYVKDIA